MTEEGRQPGRRVISATDPAVTFHADANAQLVPQTKRFVDPVPLTDKKLAKMSSEILKKPSMSTFSQQLEAARYRISHLGPRQQHHINDTTSGRPSDSPESNAEDTVQAAEALLELDEHSNMPEQNSPYTCSPASAIAANMRTRPTRLKIKRSLNNLASKALNRKGSKEHTPHERYHSDDASGRRQEPFSPFSSAGSSIDNPRSDKCNDAFLMPDKAARVFGTKNSRNTSGTYQTTPSSASPLKTRTLLHSASAVSIASGSIDEHTSCAKNAHGSSCRPNCTPDSTSPVSSRRHEYLDKSLPPTPSSKNAHKHSSYIAMNNELTASGSRHVLERQVNLLAEETVADFKNSFQEDLGTPEGTACGNSDESSTAQVVSAVGDDSDLIDFTFDAKHQHRPKIPIAVTSDWPLLAAPAEPGRSNASSPSMCQRVMSPMRADTSPSLIPGPLEVSAPIGYKHTESLEPLLDNSALLSRQASVRSLSLGSVTAYPMLFDPRTPTDQQTSISSRSPQAMFKGTSCKVKHGRKLLNGGLQHGWHDELSNSPARDNDYVRNDAPASTSEVIEGLLLPQTTYDPTATARAKKSAIVPPLATTSAIMTTPDNYSPYHVNNEVEMPHTPHLSRLLAEVKEALASQLEFEMHRQQEHQASLFRQFEEKVVHQLSLIEARLTQPAAVQAGQLQATHTPPTTAGSSFNSGLAQMHMTSSIAMTQHNMQPVLQASTTPVISRGHHGTSSARSSPSSVARAVQAAGHNVDYVNGEMMPLAHTQAQGGLQTGAGTGEYWARLGQKQVPPGVLHPAFRGD